MSQNRSTLAERGRRSLSRLAVGLGLLALPLAGCDDLLQVEDPDVATVESIQSREALPTVLAAAIGDFQVAYGGYQGAGGSSGEGQILVSGLLADELRHTGTFTTRQEIDQRDMRTDNSTVEQVFRELQRARATAERAVDLYQQFDPDAPGQALANALAGFSYVFLAENWCSGVPISRITLSGDTEYGPPLSTDSLLDRAVARFNEAIRIAETDEEGEAEAYASLARVGLGRALLNLNRADQAAQAVAGVPPDFEFLVEHSATSARQYNGVWYMNINAGRYSPASNESGEGLNFLQDPQDPRAPWSEATREPFDTGIPDGLYFFQQKYPDRATPTVLASGIEARLIEAEAALRSGNWTRAMQIHNALRAAIDLAPLDFAGLSDAQLVDLHFRERALWLWLTGHRHGDLRRLVRQYGRPVEQVFPSGEFFRPGQRYGDDVVFPIPEDEQNNPEAPNVSQCDTSQV